MALLIPNSIELATLDDSQTRSMQLASERHEDDSLSGYNNLGVGSNTVSFNLSSNVRVNAQGGSDTVTVAPNDTRGFTIYGGSGDDHVFGGGGNDTIYGGSGA